MNKIFFVILVLSLYAKFSYAQKSIIRNDARFLFRPLLFVDYNLYHWYKPPSLTNSVNAGQIFNVLPGIGGGFILGKKTTLLFCVEATIKYHPFSLDLDGYQGMGSIAFPVLANFRIPLDGFFFMQIGGGLQWTHINLHQRTSSQLSNLNTFFITCIAEIAAGVEEHLFLMYFLRFGYHPQGSVTFDFGLKFGLNGSLWE
ncbi:MAG TPA: hypothetical protein EYO58_11190 [Flavobacteriales bacterium]|nr:hypothetical protein [Flavobacteriales bacterium]